jgi:hypothetical protein
LFPCDLAVAVLITVGQLHMHMAVHHDTFFIKDLPPPMQASSSSSSWWESRA